jgi:hypothetical protein
MRLIALRDFRNTHPKEIRIENAINESHVHKGAIFEIDEKAKGGSELILELNVNGCVGDATEDRTVKAITSEVAAEKRKAEATEAKVRAK